MTFLHGIKVNEPLDGARPILEKSSAVIGLVAIAADADADAFPLNKPVLLTDVQAAIAKAGVAGTLAKSLTEIANQGSPLTIVVRVAPGVAGDGLTQAEATEANVIGTAAGGSYTGLQALLAAEVQLKVKPRILGAPGLTSQAVVDALGIAAGKLNGFAYPACAGALDVTDAVAYRCEFGAREIMLIWPDFVGGAGGTWSGKAEAIALGLRAALDERVGWHKSLSNVVIAGVTGISKDVHFDLQDMSTDAGVLNEGDVTTLVHMQGYRFWGNRTCSDEPLFAFEVAVRTGQAIKDAIADGLVWAIDKPMTRGLVTDIVETINKKFRQWKAEGRIIGATCWYDPASNDDTNLAAGRLVLDYDYTPCAPLEGLILNQRITSKYYQGFGDTIAA